ncbi:MAG: SpoIIE family protein phosphatase [Anaerolineae bacterium]|nr:SpoIIE family protein phosphatase [Anaerolineae bacterium]
MAGIATHTAPLLDWSVASQAKPGFSESGDQYWAKLLPGTAQVAVIDGLGHGDKAAEVARAAIDTLDEHAGEPVVALLERCHRALLKTRRGAVMSLAAFDGHAGTVTWVGIGNVRGVLLRANPGAERPRESLLLRGGIVGYQIPTPRPVVLPIAPGDTLIFATDGIRSGFVEELNAHDTPQAIADRIFEAFGRGTDDALVLVARYNGANGSPGEAG